MLAAFVFGGLFLSSQVSSDARVVCDRDDLRRYILEGSKPIEKWVVGTEHEKFGWRLEDAAPIDYFGQSGISEVLHSFKAFGWTDQGNDKHLLALSRLGATITLEPGGQLELSGAPLRSLLDTERELKEHVDELTEISRVLGLAWSGVGFYPFGQPDDAPRMPKPRYDILEARLRKAGQWGIHMMRQTATVQANLDFSDEIDAMRKWRAALMLQPIVVAMFANSPIVDGCLTGDSSFRARVWLDTDDARCRLPDSLLDIEPRLDDYIDWTLDVPMLFIHRDEQYLDCRGRTFKDYIRDGFREHRATIGDYALHLSTVFPDVRLKQFLEVRAADMGSLDSVTALSAFHTGLLYDERALEQTLEIFKSVTPGVWRCMREQVCRDGLRTIVAGLNFGDLAQTLVGVAKDGLSRWEPEAVHLLDGLHQRLDQRLTPADALMTHFRTHQAQRDLLELTRII